MTDATKPLSRRFAGGLALALALAAALGLAGCGGPATGDVSGTVKVDGQTPAEGSSITFVPAEGNSSPGGGKLIENGRYAVTLPTGSYKVEIRVPRPLKGAKAAPAGDGPQPGGPGGGPGGPANIEESLPAKYNDKTELTIDVKSGKNEKSWDLKSGQ